MHLVLIILSSFSEFKSHILNVESYEPDINFPEYNSIKETILFVCPFNDLIQVNPLSFEFPIFLIFKSPF